jgi:hypothetical protein
LHYESRILVALLRKRVKFCNSVIECLFGEMARAIGTIQNLIIKYREIEGEPKTDRVCWGQFGDGNIGGGLVSIEGLVGRVFLLAAVANSGSGGNHPS